MTQHDCLTSLLGDGDKSRENVASGPTRPAKIGQNSLVSTQRAQQTNQVRTPAKWAKEVPIYLCFKIQYNSPLSLSLCLLLQLTQSECPQFLLLSYAFFPLFSRWRLPFVVQTRVKTEGTANSKKRPWALDSLVCLLRENASHLIMRGGEGATSEGWSVWGEVEEGRVVNHGLLVCLAVHVWRPVFCFCLHKSK